MTTDPYNAYPPKQAAERTGNLAAICMLALDCGDCSADSKALWQRDAITYARRAAHYALLAMEAK
jgi:hypothetical protein